MRCDQCSVISAVFEGMATGPFAPKTFSSRDRIR